MGSCCVIERCLLFLEIVNNDLWRSYAPVHPLVYVEEYNKCCKEKHASEKKSNEHHCSDQRAVLRSVVAPYPPRGKHGDYDQNEHDDVLVLEHVHALYPCLCNKIAALPAGHSPD